MKRLIAVATVLLFSSSLCAHEPPSRRDRDRDRDRDHSYRHDHGPVGGSFTFGLSSGRLTEEDDDPHTYTLETDSGGGVNLTGAMRFEPGLMARLSYVTTTAEEWEDCDNVSGCTRHASDFVVRETRAGLFYAPPLNGRPLGFRAGGGYEYFKMGIKGTSAQLETDGGFVEGALIINAGRVATFDVGLALMALDNEFGDAAGGEIFAGVAFHVGPVDIGVGGRSFAFTTEVEDQSTGADYTFTDGYAEGRVTVGMQFGYGAPR